MTVDSPGGPLRAAEAHIGFSEMPRCLPAAPLPFSERLASEAALSLARFILRVSAESEEADRVSELIVIVLSNFCEIRCVQLGGCGASGRHKRDYRAANGRRDCREEEFCRLLADMIQIPNL